MHSEVANAHSRSAELPCGSPGAGNVSVKHNCVLLPTVQGAFCNGRHVVSKAAGGKNILLRRKIETDKVLCPFFSSPKSLCLAASAHSCCLYSPFCHVPGRWDWSKSDGCFWPPGSLWPWDDSLCYSWTERTRHIFYIKFLCSDYVFPVFHRIFKSLQIPPLAR